MVGEDAITGRIWLGGGQNQASAVRQRGGHVGTRGPRPGVSCHCGHSIHRAGRWSRPRGRALNEVYAVTHQRCRTALHDWPRRTPTAHAEAVAAGEEYSDQDLDSSGEPPHVARPRRASQATAPSLIAAMSDSLRGLSGAGGDAASKKLRLERERFDMEVQERAEARARP